MDRKQSVTTLKSSIRLDFYFKGIRCRETLKLNPSKANILYAERKLSAIKYEIALGTFQYSHHFPNSKNALLGAKSTNKTISQALDDYIKAGRRTFEMSTWRNYRSAIEHHLKPTFGHIRLADITSNEIKNWIGKLTISNKRINNVFIPLRTVLNDAFADGLIERNPIIRVSNLAVRFEEPQPFTPDEVSAIIKELPQQGKNLIQFAIWTGLRHQS